MGTINPSIPTVGQPNSTEDVDIRDGMTTIRDEINGNLDNANIKNAANIAGSKLADNSVAPSKLSNGTAGQLLIANASGIVTSTTVTGDVTINSSGVTQIGAGTVGTTEIADNSINHDKMTNNSVNTDELHNSAVTTAKIADDAVTVDKIGDDAVTNVQLKDSASTDGDRAVTTNHIRNNAITKDKLYTAVVNDHQADVLLDGDTQYVHNFLSQPAGIWLLNVNLVIRTGTSSNWENLVIDIGTANGTMNYTIDPINGTTGSNERFSWGWSQNVTTTASGVLRVSYKVSGSPYPSNVYVLHSSFSGFCIRS